MTGGEGNYDTVPNVFSHLWKSLVWFNDQFPKYLPELKKKKLPQTVMRNDTYSYTFGYINIHKIRKTENILSSCFYSSMCRNPSGDGR